MTTNEGKSRMKEKYDGIVVGAGPAGGMAARVISKEGHSILVIDKKKKVGQPVQCGEAVSKFALKSNKVRVKKEWVKNSFKGLKIFVPNGKYFFSFVKGYCIDRTKFDKYIIDQAVHKGCEILLNTKVMGIKRKNKLWYVKTKRKIFKSKFLIGADGAESNVATWLGILETKDFIKALQYKFRNINIKEKKLLLLYMNSKFRNGYAWVFPRGDEYNIGVGGIGNIKRWLDDFCRSKNIDIKKKFSVSYGMVPKRYRLKSFTKDSALIVGDAAGLTNPIFGGGIHSALFSGRLAGKIVCFALDSNDPKLISRYDNEVRESPFCDPILQRANKFFYSLNNDEWNFVGEVFENKNYNDMSYLRISKKFILKPKFLLKVKKFKTLKRAIDMSHELI